jgi:large-conductance mechanosensitive channel
MEGCGDNPGPADPNLIAHSQVEVGSAILMAADGPPSPGQGSTTINIDVETEEEAERVFKALSEGGKVTFPIGDLISAIISFLSVALVVYFVFVLPMNTFKAHVEARKGTPAEEPQEEPAAATEAELLVEIRDLLARNNSRS